MANKQMTSRQQKWFDLGVKMATKYACKDDAYDALDSDLSDSLMYGRHSNGLFFLAGFIGRQPEWRTGYRYGEIPESGRSANHADGTWEDGVSCICLDADRESIYDVTLGWQGIEKIKIGGWYIGGAGSDGEPLLIDCEKIEGDIDE